MLSKRAGGVRDKIGGRGRFEPSRKPWPPGHNARLVASRRNETVISEFSFVHINGICS
jgi:hypothetical protein